LVTFDTVREMGLAMPGTEVSTSYGTPALKVRGQLIVRLQENPDTLVVRTEMEARDELLAADPDTYFITDHYLKYPWILVRLSRIHPDALRDLLLTAWRLAGRAAKKPARKAKGRG
jgi:hypothetical protein